MDVMDIVYYGIAGAIGFLARSLLDLLKLRIGHRNEMEKMSINIYFDLAKNFYFGILHFIDNLKDDVQDIVNKGVTDDIITKTFYDFAQYQRELFKFTARAGYVWFLTKLENEDKIVRLQDQMNDVIPFNNVQKSYLATIGVKHNYEPISLYEFKKSIEDNKELQEYFLRFKKWISSKENQNTFLKILVEFSEILKNDLDSAFKDWYNLRRYKWI